MFITSESGAVFTCKSCIIDGCLMIWSCIKPSVVVIYLVCLDTLATIAIDSGQLEWKHNNVRKETYVGNDL